MDWMWKMQDEEKLRWVLFLDEVKTKLEKEILEWDLNRDS